MRGQGAGAVKARCQCGRLTAKLPDHPLLTVACHCLDCQRRIGASFGVLSYYEEEGTVIDGEARAYRRLSAEGNVVETFFCPHCGSTVYLKLAKRPGLIGMAVGAIADPAHPPPVWSAWEETRRRWIGMSCDVRRFPRGD